MDIELACRTGGGVNDAAAAIERDISLEHFPSRLYRMLEYAHTHGMADVISWTEDGQSFIVHQPKVFEKGLMRVFFNQSKYKSFQRQLNFYEYYRATANRSRVYTHPLFRRGEEEKCRDMRRQAKPRRRSSKKKITALCKRPYLTSEILPLDESSPSSEKKQKPSNCSITPVSSRKEPDNNVSFDVREVIDEVLSLIGHPKDDEDFSLGQDTFEPINPLKENITVFFNSHLPKINSVPLRSCNNTNVHPSPFLSITDDDEYSIGTIDSMETIDSISNIQNVEYESSTHRA